MKILKFLRLMTFGAIALFIMAACSDDDGNGGGSSSGSDAAAKGVIDFDGERLYAINDCNVEYDAQGRVARITQDDHELEINYARGTITVDGETGTIKFNNEGYITEIVSSWDDILLGPASEDGSISHPGSREQGTSTATYTYANGFLTKISILTNETSTESGTNKVTKYQISDTHTLYWNLGNLVQITNSGWESEDGGDKETWSETYSINYGTQVNKYRQFPVTIVEEALYFDDPLYMMAAVGLFGKGPTTLPQSMAGNDDYGTWSMDIFFNVNSKAAISKEIINDYETYTYYYSAPKDNNGDSADEDEGDDDEDANVGEAPNPLMHSQLAPNAKSAARTFGLRKMFAKPTHRHHK